jgi:hypothetical protein
MSRSLTLSGTSPSMTSLSLDMDLLRLVTARSSSEQAVFYWRRSVHLYRHT